MFKKIIALSIVACSIAHTGVNAMAAAKQAISNNPTSATIVGAGVLAATTAAALAQTNYAQSPLAYGAKVATAVTAGAFVGEASKKIADNIFTACFTNRISAGTHTEALAKKLFATVICYGMNQAITAATAYLIGGTAKPGAKLTGEAFSKLLSKLFTVSTAIGLMKNDGLMLQGALPLSN